MYTTLHSDCIKTISFIPIASLVFALQLYDKHLTADLHALHSRALVRGEWCQKKNAVVDYPKNKLIPKNGGQMKKMHRHFVLIWALVGYCKSTIIRVRWMTTAKSVQKYRIATGFTGVLSSSSGNVFIIRVQLNFMNLRWSSIDLTDVFLESKLRMLNW